MMRAHAAREGCAIRCFSLVRDAFRRRHTGCPTYRPFPIINVFTPWGTTRMRKTRGKDGAPSGQADTYPLTRV